MRKTLIVLLLCTVALMAGYASFRGYKVWKQSHLMRMAREFAAKSDGRNALLCVNQTLHSNPRNIDANRFMADLMEASRNPNRLIWRGRVVELNPKSVEDRLALARTAISMRDLITATNALEGVSEASKRTVEFQNLAGTVAIEAGQLIQAEDHFFEAVRLDLTNPAPRLNLAIVRLLNTNAQSQAEARASLKDLLVFPNLACAVLRELVADSMRHQQTNDALVLSDALIQKTNSVFSDRLLRLQVLRESKQPGFKSALQTYQAEAAGDPGKIYELASWQLNKSGPAEVLDWMRRMPLEVQTNQPVAMLEAECLNLLKDWRGLQAFLTPQNWKELNFVRHAFVARAMRGQNLIDSTKTVWEQALKAADNRKESLVMLLRLASQWNWANEREELLMTIINRYASEKWAVLALTHDLYVEGRTRTLMSLYSRQAKASPADIQVKNNLAFTALLLNAQELKPHELALEVYQKSPTNAAFVSTYAFSLHLQDKNTEALRVLEQLQTQALEDPGIAGYYGLILKATGNPAKARKYLALAVKAKLLPEERKLLEKALSGV